MTILRKLNSKDFAVIHEGEQRKTFLGKSAKLNESRAIAFAKKYLSPTNFLTRDTFLFTSRAQTVTWITDDGDNSEPPVLCGHSLVRIADDTGREIVLTGEEAFFLAKGLTNLNIKISKGVQS